MLKTVLAAGACLAAFSISAYAQQPRGKANQQAASADTDDFTEGNLKFHRVGGFLQVVDTVKMRMPGR